MNSRAAKFSSISPNLSSAFDVFAANSHRSAFVRDLPFCCTAEELRSLMQREVGVDLEDVIICRNSEGKTLQYGCVMFQSEEDADRTVAKLHGYRLFGRDIRIIKYNKDAIMETSSTGAVLVSFKGVSQELELITEATIRAAFEQFGEISHVSIRSHLYNSYGIQGGFGFLGFVDSSLNNRVVAEINQTILNGVQYDCNWSKHINKSSQGSDGASSHADGSSFFKRKQGVKDTFVRSSQASGNSPAGHDTNTRTSTLDSQHSIPSSPQLLQQQQQQQMQYSPAYVYTGGSSHASAYPSSSNVPANMVPYTMYNPVGGALPPTSMGMMYAGGQPTNYYGLPMVMPMGMMPAITPMMGSEYAPQSTSFVPMQRLPSGAMIPISSQSVSVPVQQQAMVSRNSIPENSQPQQQQPPQHHSHGKQPAIFRNPSISPSMANNSSSRADPSSSNVPNPQHQVHLPSVAIHNSSLASASSSSSPKQTNSHHYSDSNPGNISGQFVPQQSQQQLGAQSHHPVTNTHSYSPASGPMPAPRTTHLVSTVQQTSHEPVPNANSGYHTAHPMMYAAAQPVFPPPPLLQQPMQGQSHAAPQMMPSPVLSSMPASYRSIPLPAHAGMNMITSSPTLSTPPHPTMQTAGVRGQAISHPSHQQLQPPNSQQPMQQHQASPNTGVPLPGSYVSNSVGYPSGSYPSPSSSAMYSYQTVPVVPPPLANISPGVSYMMMDGNGYVYTNAVPQHIQQQHLLHQQHQQQPQPLPVNATSATTVAGPSSYAYAPSRQANPGVMLPGMAPQSFVHNSPAQYHVVGTIPAPQPLQLVHGHQQYQPQYGQPYGQQSAIDSPSNPAQHHRESHR